MKNAEANKLIKLAEAKCAELVNTSYQGEGSEKLIGLEMAEVLRGIDTILINVGGPGSINPLDLESMVKMFESKTGEKK